MISTARSPVSRFLAWWRGQLGALIPRPVRWVFAGSQTTLCLVLGETEIRVEAAGADGTKTLGNLPLDVARSADGQGALQKIIGRKPARVDRAVLRLGQHQTLATQLRLPLGAAGDLARAVDAEIPRVTPFNAENVVRDFRVLRADAEKQTLTVDLVVAPRRALDGALDLAGQLGIKPVRVVPDRDANWPEGSNLLPPEQRHSPGRAGARLVQASACLAVLLGCAWLALWYDGQRSALAESSETVAQLRREIAAIQASDQRGTRALEALNAIVSEKHRTPSALSILDEATRALPDGSWLSAFSYAGGNVTLTGYSDNPPGILQVLEDADSFDGAEFIAPLTMDAQVQKERFRARARLSVGGDAK